MIKNVMFDLDGTLLPMDQDRFIEAYFKKLACKFASFGYDPKKLIQGIWVSTAAMVNNDGKLLNEKVFWKSFAKFFGDKVYEDKEKFDEFYRTDFDSVKAECGFNPLARATVHKIKDMGLKVVLATNPIFPLMATEKRIGWAGLNPSDFELFTTYDNMGFCKPNLDYYRDILAKLNMDARQTVMVGNDVSEDMVARELGMKVFLLTDCLINKNNEDIDQYPHGNFNDFNKFLEENL